MSKKMTQKYHRRCNASLKMLKRLQITDAILKNTIKDLYATDLRCSGHSGMIVMLEEMVELNGKIIKECE